MFQLDHVSCPLSGAFCIIVVVLETILDLCLKTSTFRSVGPGASQQHRCYGGFTVIPVDSAKEPSPIGRPTKKLKTMHASTPTVVLLPQSSQPLMAPQEGDGVVPALGTLRDLRLLKIYVVFPCVPPLALLLLCIVVRVGAACTCWRRRARFALCNPARRGSWWCIFAIHTIFL